jgi:hypothetical protein
MNMTPQPGNAMDWEGRTLFDREGDKIGKIEELFLVEETGRPEWALVKLGRLGSRTTLVPLIGAEPTSEGVRAAYAKSVVSEAPRMDGEGEPSEQQVSALYRHYDIEDATNGHAANPRDEEHAEPEQAPARSDSGNGASPAGGTELVSGSADLREEPFSDLVKQVRDEAQTLVGQEIKLAKAEIAEKAKEVRRVGQADDRDRKGGSQVGPGSDEIDEIRQQIDESRENLGSAVGALAYKADVKNRGKEALEDKKEAVMEKVDELKSKVTGGDGEGGGIGDKVKSKLPEGDAIKSKLPDGDAIKSKIPDGVGDAAARIGDAAPSKEDVKAKAQVASNAASAHPFAVTAGAAAAGLVAGVALPETDLEREKLGPTAQKVRADVQGRVQDTVEQIKHGAKDAIGSVADAVKTTGQEHGGKVGEMAEKAADKTQEQVGPDR